MIREDRDPDFWIGVYEHPAVKPGVSLGHDLDIRAIVANPALTPLRADHGGFFFMQLDGLGRIQEMHTLFTPEGWGREALQALKEGVAEMFERGASLITTFDVEGDFRARPPLSLGFRPCGPYGPAAGASLRTWALTRNAWIDSPARQRMATCR